MSVFNEPYDPPLIPLELEGIVLNVGCKESLFENKAFTPSDVINVIREALVKEKQLPDTVIEATKLLVKNVDHESVADEIEPTALLGKDQCFSSCMTPKSHVFQINFCRNNSDDGFKVVPIKNHSKSGGCQMKTRDHLPVDTHHVCYVNLNYVHKHQSLVSYTLLGIEQ